MTKKELMNILKKYVHEGTAEDIYGEITNLLVETPDKDQTIPEILMDAIRKVRDDHGVHLDSIHIEWQHIREAGTMFPYSEPLQVNFNGGGSVKK